MVVLYTAWNAVILMGTAMLPAIKIFMTDTLIMSDATFYGLLIICFLLGFPVGAILYTFTGKLIQFIWSKVK